MTVIAEIAGRDSAAALIGYAQEHRVAVVVPTMARTGTDHGETTCLEKNVSYLRTRLPEADFLPAVPLFDPALWSALNGRFISLIERDFGTYSPCPGCHLYLHLLRLPLSLAYDGAPIISGERESHGSGLKLSQTPALLDAFAEITASVGSRLELPVRKLHENAQVEGLVGADWPAGGRQLSCLLSGNYLDATGDAIYDAEAERRFIDGFILPAGKALAPLVGREGTDYAQAVKEAVWPAG